MVSNQLLRSASPSISIGGVERGGVGHGLGRPFRAWWDGVAGFPGRCPGLELRRAVGAARRGIIDAPPSRGRRERLPFRFALPLPKIHRCICPRINKTTCDA